MWLNKSWDAYVLVKTVTQRNLYRHETAQPCRIIALCVSKELKEMWAHECGVLNGCLPSSVMEWNPIPSSSVCSKTANIQNLHRVGRQQWEARTGVWKSSTIMCILSLTKIAKGVVVNQNPGPCFSCHAEVEQGENMEVMEEYEYSLSFFPKQQLQS